MMQDKRKVEVAGSLDLIAGLRDLSDEELDRLAHATGDPDSIGTGEP
jgi:hypothetical protein